MKNQERESSDNLSNFMSPCTDPVRNTNRSNFYIEPKSNYVPMSTKNQGPVKAFDPV